MMDVETLPFVVLGLVVAGIVIAIPTSVMSRKLWKTLERRHPGVWQELGRPKIGPMRASQGRMLRRYLGEGESLSLDDPEVSALARKLRWLARVVEALFWAVVALVLWLAVTSSR